MPRFNLSLVWWERPDNLNTVTELRNFHFIRGWFFDKLKYSNVLIQSLYSLDAPVFYQDINNFRGYPTTLMKG